MCGFFCCLSEKNLNKNEISNFERCANLLEHRGRDSSHAINDEYSYFKSFRHKILDLSENGNQPFMDKKKKFLIVFNGIIFNHIEIRKEIIKKYNQNFISKCDTETILYGYIFFGEKIFNKLKGYWSLIIYDLRNKNVIASRDRFGVKPLYYYVEENKIIYSSEIKSLKFYLSKKNKLNLNQFNSYIKRGWLDHNEETLYSNIKSVKPATFQIIKKSKIHKTKIYWNYPSPSSKKINFENVKDKLVETFSSATISDVPIAALLSSGIDSNAIVSILKNLNILSQKKIETFTVNPVKNLEDIEIIKKASLEYGVKYNIVDFNENNFDYKNKIDDLIKIQDEPIFNSSHLYQFELRKIIHKKNFHVLLTGDGADEIFAGYQKIYISYLASMFKILSKKEFIKLLKNSYEFMGINSFNLLSLLKKYFYNGLNKRNTQENKFGNEIIKNEYLVDDQKIFDKKKYNNLNSNENNYFLFYELMERFRIDVPHHCRNEDRISSYFHICARPLFLDHDLLETVWGFHFENFMKNGTNKYMLRKSLENILPNYINRIKKKYVRPGNNSFLVYNKLHDSIQSMLHEENNNTLFKSNLNKIFENDCKSNNFNNAYIWLRYYFFNRWIALNDIEISN